MKVRALAILISLVLCLSLVAAIGSVHPSSVRAIPMPTPNTWYVATTGNDTTGSGNETYPWLTIQHAIGNASDGDTIIVGPGEYDAGNQIDPGQSANLTIRSSDGPGNTTIYEPGTDSMFAGFRIEQKGEVIDGFTIRNFPFGIYLTGGDSGDNCTIKNNIIEDNGHGIWVEPYIYGSIITNNTICNNTLADSGIHISANSHDNLISNNTIENNDDGIWIGGYDNLIINNTIENNGDGIWIEGYENKIIGNNIFNNTGWAAVGCGIQMLGQDAMGNVIHLNNIEGNSPDSFSYGVFSEGAPVDASNNWWGNFTGPSDYGPGFGDAVSDNVNYGPWLGAPLVLPSAHYEHLFAGDQQVVDASNEANTTVTLNVSAEESETDIIVAGYQSQPFPDELFPDTALGKYVDVFVSDPDAVDWPILVNVTYTHAEVTKAGIDENTLGLYYYLLLDPFERCSDTGVDTQNNVIWANVTRDEYGYGPRTPFGAGGLLLQNIPPVAYDQVVDTLQNQPKSITLDADDADGDPLTYSIVTGPSHGMLSGSPPNLTYTPNAGYYGPDSFTFKANDGKADSNIATVSITVEVPAVGTPTLSQWGIIGMAIVFAAALVWVGRRRLAAKAGS